MYNLASSGHKTASVVLNSLLTWASLHCSSQLLLDCCQSNVNLHFVKLRIQKWPCFEFDQSDWKLFLFLRLQSILQHHKITPKRPSTQLFFIYKFGQFTWRSGPGVLWRKKAKVHRLLMAWRLANLLPNSNEKQTHSNQYSDLLTGAVLQCTHLRPKTMTSWNRRELELNLKETDKETSSLHPGL